MLREGRRAYDSCHEGWTAESRDRAERGSRPCLWMWVTLDNRCGWWNGGAEAIVAWTREQQRGGSEPSSEAKAVCGRLRPGTAESLESF